MTGTADRKAHAAGRSPISIAAVARVLHPLDEPPQAQGWNRDELVDFFGDGPRTDAAVLIALRDVARPTVVFTVRHEGLRAHAGQVSFPGGRIEADDDGVVAAALRESAEEIGLDPAGAQPLGLLDRMETVSGYIVTPVVARLDSGAELSPRSPEVTAVFEQSLDFLLDPANLRKRAFVTQGKRRSVYEYAGTQPLIWGATAMMLVNLMRRMELMP